MLWEHGTGGSIPSGQTATHEIRRMAAGGTGRLTALWTRATSRFEAWAASEDHVCLVTMAACLPGTEAVRVRFPGQAPCGYGVVATHHLAMVKPRVRFPVSAPSPSRPISRAAGLRPRAFAVRVRGRVRMESEPASGRASLRPPARTWVGEQSLGCETSAFRWLVAHLVRAPI